MNKEKILNFVKTNMLSLICGVVAIVAVAATFYPVGGWLDDLKTRTDQRASIYSSLSSLRTKSRKLPLTDPTQTEQADLKTFPNADAIKAGESVTKAVSKQSNDMVDLVVRLNQQGHDLLVPDALPNPVSDTPRFRFGDLYKLVMSVDPAVSINTDARLKEAKKPNVRNDILRATMPPIETEIAQEKADLYTKSYAPQVITVNGVAVNEAEVTANYNAEAARLPDVMKFERARNFKVYAPIDALTMNPNVIGVAAPNTVDIWYAQQSLWVQQDIAGKVAEINAPAENILTAPIKQLVRLTLSTGLYAFPPGSSNGVAPAAAAVEGADSGTIAKALALSPTGRVSNAFYDVIPFELVLDVDASKVPDVLVQFTRNKLMDIYNMDVFSVDASAARAQGFIYGPMPVVRIRLSGETLFLRRWTASLMPPAIRAQLGVQAPASPGGATPTAMAQ